MIYTSYQVTLCDMNPMMGKCPNVSTFRFASRHKAMKFVEEGVRQGFYVVIREVEINKPSVFDVLPEV